MIEDKDSLAHITGRLDSLSKRARIVVEHILQHGLITTEELERDYGYTHPLRAARDVREAGIPLETVRIRSSDGRVIAAYKLGSPSQAENAKLRGRRGFSKQFKSKLYEMSDGRCAICSGQFERVICRSITGCLTRYLATLKARLWTLHISCCCADRATGPSPGHVSTAPNWLGEKSSQTCECCYWANPLDHSHVALRKVRRTDILWSQDEVQVYERLSKLAAEKHLSVSEHIKNILATLLSQEEE